MAGGAGCEYPDAYVEPAPEFFAQMVAMIGFSSIFPFLPLYIQSLGTVSGLSVELCTGLVFSGQAFSMMIAAPIWGASPPSSAFRIRLLSVNVAVILPAASSSGTNF